MPGGMRRHMHAVLVINSPDRVQVKACLPVVPIDNSHGALSGRRSPAIQKFGYEFPPSVLSTE